MSAERKPPIISMRRLVLNQLTQGQRLTAAQLAHRTGIPTRNINQIMWAMVADGRISRCKPEGGGYYRYFLSEDQLARHLSDLPGEPPAAVKRVPACAVAERLSVLREIHERTDFRGNPILQLIIKDYEAAMGAVKYAERTEVTHG